jgi:hypothetical protein
MAQAGSASFNAQSAETSNPSSNQQENNMINICIPQTRWTYRIWIYIGFRKSSILGRRAFIEILDHGKAVWGTTHY